MTIESSRMQIPTAAPNPLLNVQNEIQKGTNRDEQQVNAAPNTTKQVAAGNQVVNEPRQQQATIQNVSDGRIDIKI